MVSKEEEEQQLKRKLEDLEGTVQRLNGRLEKNQKEHETELRSTQNLLETIKSSGSQTQILLQRVQTDLEIAKKECKKYEKKEYCRRKELVELQKQLEELEKQSQD